MKRIRLLALLLLILFLLSSCKQEPDSLLQIYVLDVGQGDCILLRTEAGDVLVDTGTEASQELLCLRLEQLGVETLELLKSVTKTVCPDLVVVIDALAARSCHRLGTTVQLSNRGIMPGSGIGNHRQSIDRETMGVPVFSLGIPTVVSSSALIHEALTEAELPTEGETLTTLLNDGESFFVSPKDCDTVVAEGARLFADAIGLAFRS